MLKKAKVSQLILGMRIKEFCGAWPVDRRDAGGDQRAAPRGATGEHVADVW